MMYKSRFLKATPQNNNYYQLYTKLTFQNYKILIIQTHSNSFSRKLDFCSNVIIVANERDIISVLGFLSSTSIKNLSLTRRYPGAQAKNHPKRSNTWEITRTKRVLQVTRLQERTYPCNKIEAELVRKSQLERRGDEESEGREGGETGWSVSRKIK